MAPKFYLVLVHGITNRQADTGENRASTFFSKRYPDAVIIEFHFFDHSDEENPGVDFLREPAKLLLDRLKGLTLSPFVFIGHDLGGSLIKKALVIAAEESEYQEIFMNTAGTVFFGTPHKAKDTFAWERQVLRLLSISDSASIRPAKLLKFLPQALEDLYTDYATISHAYGVVNVLAEGGPGSNSSPIVDPASGVFNQGNGENIVLPCSYLDLWRLKSGEQGTEVVCRRIEALLGVGLQDATFLRKKFLQALSRVDPETHQLKLTKAAPGTMNWISDHPAFADWMNIPGKDILYVCGPPGSGTTVVTSHLLRMLLERKGSSNAIVQSFTFNKQHIQARTPQSLLMSLSRQLLSTRPSLFYHVSGLCAALSHFDLFTQETLLSLFGTLLKGTFGTPVICIIHATQECDEPLQHVIGQLEHLTALSNGSLKIIMTEEDSHGADHDSCTRICLAANNTKESIISQLVETSVNRLMRRKPHWKGLEKDIREALCAPPASYLLALRRANLLLEPDARTMLVAMKQRVNNLPGSLDESYARALERIHDDQKSWVHSALRWIVYAARPLTRSELAVAVAFQELGNKASVSSLLELVSSDIINDLNQVVGHLFKLVDGRVNLIHRSFRDFLTQGPGEKHLDPINHTQMLRTCLQYLDHFGKPFLDRKNIELPAVEFNLVEYATVYWPVHCMLSNSEPQAMDILSRFLHTKNIDSWSELYVHFKGVEIPHEPLNTSFLIGCRFGFLELVEASILELKSAHDSFEKLRQGLNIGARYGHVQVVKALIREGAKSDMALGLAARSGVFEIVSDLLSVHPSVEAVDSEGWTPLHHSAARGYEAITSLLLKVTPDPDVMTSDESTPLHLAATTGQLAIVKMLVEIKANVTLLSGSGYDALKLAAQSGFSDIVQYLISNDADVRAVSPGGVTALHVAVESGHLSTTRILLKHGSDIRVPNESGLTPTHLAAKRGYLDILKLLLDAQKKESPSTSAENEPGDRLSLVKKFQIDDDEAESPLQLAASAGHLDIVRELLQRNVADNDREKDICTAVYRSVAIGYGAIVQELLNHDVKCIAEDDDGNTALHLAASRGHLEVLTQLLQRPQFDINGANRKGWTALHKAAELGDVEIVKKILTGKPDLRRETDDGATPLHIAAQAGHLLNLRVLMSELDTSQVRDNDGKTPLSRAASAGQTDIVRELLPIYVPGQDESYPFHSAAREGHRDVVKLFLERNWDVDDRNASRQTPLHLACWCPNPLALVELLLSADPDVNAEDEDLETPLSYAARGGTADVAKALLKGGADINATDKRGSTPLFRASYAGNVDVVKELLAWKPAPDLDIQSDRGWTALHAAYDSPEITQLLLNKGADASLTNEDGDPPMLHVIKSGYIEVFKCLLQAEIESHGVSTEHVSAAVRCAVAEGREDMLQFLIEKGADVHAQNEQGSTALHVAAHGGQIALLRLLIEKGADVHKTSEYWGSVLTAAAQASAFECAKLLLENGVDVNAEGGEYHTALQAAASASSDVAKLLLEHKADPNVVGGKFGTALLAAASVSNAEAARLLLEAGANPNEKGSSGETPLQKAAFTGTIATVELLLERGAIVKATGGPYGTALNASIEQGHLTCAETLLNHGADPNQLIPGHATPVQIAARKDLLEILKLLVDRGADLQVIDEDGRTITMLALSWNSHSIVEYLLKREDILLEKKDGAERTPLMIAVRQGSDSVETLLKKGADPNARDWQEKTPLVQAVMIDFQEVVTALLDHGADPTLVDSRGRGPLYWACRQGSVEVFDNVLRALKTRQECSTHCERAIHAAVAAKRSDFISKLLAIENTRPNEPGADNWLPIYTAQRYGLGWIVARLISAGAIDTDLFDVVGRRRLPSKWHPLDRSPSLLLGPDQMTVKTGGPPNPDNMSVPRGVVMADFPMPGEGIYYFEVKIDKAPENQIIGVGFCEENVPLNQTLGWNQGSWAYHGDDGDGFYGDSALPLNYNPDDGQSLNSESRKPWGPEYNTGDVIGCGVNFEKEIAFYTKNGEIIGRAFTGIRGKLYPAISLDTTEQGVAVSVTFWDGKTDPKDVFMYKGSWEASATMELPGTAQVDAKDHDDSEEGVSTPAYSSDYLQGSQ